MFTQRQRKILAILKQHKNNITSDEIARLVGVSSRTIRTEIKNILPILSRNFFYSAFVFILINKNKPNKNITISPKYSKKILIFVCEMLL